MPLRRPCTGTRETHPRVVANCVTIDAAFIRTTSWRVPSLYEPWLARVYVNRATPVTERFRFFRIPAAGVSLGLVVGPDQAKCMIAGAIQKLHSVPPFAGCEVIGPIVLRPSAVHQLFGMPASELTNQFIDAECIWRTWTPALLEQVAQERTTERRLARLLELLHMRLSRAPDVVAERIVALAASRHGAGSVRDLADASGYSERQLRRIFLDQVGLGPKEFGRMLRIIKALHALARAPMSWSSFALAHGYYDQAHFIADFREVLGKTPKRFLDSLVEPRLLEQHLAIQAID
jgi:AraC-like DNA-binding protein